jgi:hypothetical protein
MAELEADPAYRQRIAERDAAHQARVAENADEFSLVRRALSDAGLPSDDFGRFTSGRHPEVIRPSVFDYESAVPVLLAVLPRLTRPVVKEAVVRSLTTPHARPAAAAALLQEFRSTSNSSHPGLKWVIGNALATATTIEHTETLLELAVEAVHGAGRQGIVERLARITKDERIVPTLKMLLDDPDVALQAMAGLRRRLGPDEALEHIRPLTTHSSERIRRAAMQQTRRAQKAIETRSKQAPQAR